MVHFPFDSFEFIIDVSSSKHYVMWHTTDARRVDSFTVPGSK